MRRKTGLKRLIVFFVLSSFVTGCEIKEQDAPISPDDNTRQEELTSPLENYNEENISQDFADYLGFLRG